MTSREEITKMVHDDVLDIALLEDSHTQTCLCCKMSSPYVRAKYIQPSPSGPGGDYLLCPECTIDTIEEVQFSLNEFYSQIL